MHRVSILGTMLLIVLIAVIAGLFTRLGEEAFYYVTGPLLGSTLGAFAYRRDRSVLITGGAAGGLFQGIVTILVFRRGYIFSDRAMITGPLFLASVAVHLMAGLLLGMLLYLSLRWASPRVMTSDL